MRCSALLYTQINPLQLTTAVALKLKLASRNFEHVSGWLERCSWTWLLHMHERSGMEGRNVAFRDLSFRVKNRRQVDRKILYETRKKQQLALLTPPSSFVYKEPHFHPPTDSPYCSPKHAYKIPSMANPPRQRTSFGIA